MSVKTDRSHLTGKTKVRGVVTKTTGRMMRRIGRETRSEFTQFSFLFFFEAMPCFPHTFKGMPCIGRESNPGLPRGRREFYH